MRDWPNADIGWPVCAQTKPRTPDSMRCFRNNYCLKSGLADPSLVDVACSRCCVYFVLNYQELCDGPVNTLLYSRLAL